MTAAPLPPLPPAFGVEDDDVRPGGSSMIEILADDHDQLAALADQLTGEPSRRVEDVFIAVLSRHLSAEEQYLYPTVRAVLPDGTPVAERELTEDAAMLQNLQRLHALPLDDTAYPALVKTVTDQVQQHAHRAKREIFPALREHCTDNELIRLGNRVVIAQDAAPTRPHPKTPATPPANKIVDPAVAVLDKVRDVLTGRTTRPEDL